jgi:hypothetical protein
MMICSRRLYLLATTEFEENNAIMPLPIGKCGSISEAAR